MAEERLPHGLGQSLDGQVLMGRRDDFDRLGNLCVVHRVAYLIGFGSLAGNIQSHRHPVPVTDHTLLSRDAMIGVKLQILDKDNKQRKGSVANLGRAIRPLTMLNSSYSLAWPNGGVSRLFCYRKGGH